MFILGANLIGIGVAVLLVTVVFPVPSIFSRRPAWITFAVAPAYIVLGADRGHARAHPPRGQRASVVHRGARPDA